MKSEIRGPKSERSPKTETRKPGCRGPVFSAVVFLLLLTAFWSPQVAAQAQTLTYVDLVNRLTDLTYLATVPAPGEKCAQWSSYDRRSRFDAATGKYVDWDANGDGDGIIRKEGEVLVLAEMEGPGCIWRTWSAMPGKGHVRIILDGAAVPAVDLPFMGYFDGKNAPFTRSALVHTVARGWNNYTPIPYQKSCKIVAEPGWGQYYQFTYATYPKGTQVPTFKRELSGDESKALDRANEILTHCGPEVPRAERGEKTVSKVVNLASGRTTELLQIKGSGAILGLKVKLDLPKSPVDIEALRELVLQMSWDGESEPSVWAPLGDFFGTAAGANPYRSFPMGLTEDGWWYCNWYMPFANGAQIELVNDGKTARRVQCEIVHGPQKAKSEVARFHAKWHRDSLLPKEPERWIDWPILKTTGAGRFAGVMLHIWNPRGSWWGEGDEKFFVNGEKFPSTFGTGSEDYFGYAWCDPKLFQNAYHNQTHNDGNNKGHVSVNRWQITDNIPFQQSFEGCIEKYYQNQRPTLYAAVAYWYQAPGGRDPYRPVALVDRVGYWTPIETVKVKGALEGENLKVISKTGGNPQEQDMTSFEGQWSGDAHLWWTDAKPGDRLELAVPATKAGKYDLTLQLTKAPDYGIVQLSLDGQKLGAPIDLYHPSVIPTGVLNFGAKDLDAGQHTLTLEIVGANEKAVKNYMVGLDYVKLESVR
jgi:hypothetical protein